MLLAQDVAAELPCNGAKLVEEGELSCRRRVSLPPLPPPPTLIVLPFELGTMLVIVMD